MPVISMEPALELGGALVGVSIGLNVAHSRTPHLDAAYTAFGQVVEGLEVIDRTDVESKILHVRVEGAL